MSFSSCLDITDCLLLEKLHEDDQSAFTCIYERYNKMLYVLAYKYIKDSYLAEDVVQQVFLKLWETRHLLTSSVHLRNFLYTMAKNLVLNEMRDNATAIEKNYELSQKIPQVDNRLLNLLEEKDLYQQFEKTMTELTDQQRKVCQLKIFAGLSNQEVADKLHISVPTVKSHYAMGMKYIRMKMQRLLFILCFCVILSNLLIITLVYSL